MNPMSQMVFVRRCALRLGLLLASAVMLVMPADAQETETPEPAEFPTITIEIIDADIKSVDDAADLDDAQKTDLKATLGKARAALEKADAAEKQAAQFKSNIETAAADIETATKEKESVEGYDLDAAQEFDLNALNKDRSELEQKVAEAKEALSKAQAEPQRRLDRTEEIASELAAANGELAETEKKLKALEVGDDPSLTLLAQYRLLLTTRQSLAATIESLTNERSAYEAQGELPRLRVDAATAQLKQFEEDVRKLVALIAKRRLTDAEAQLQTAEDMLKAVPSTLKPYVQETIELADERRKRAGRIQEAAAKRDQVVKQYSRWHEEYERTKKRTDAVGSETSGAMLVLRRAEIPSVAVLNEQIADETDRIRKYQAELYEWEDRRVDLSDMDAAVKSATQQMFQSQRIRATPEMKDQLRKVFRLESAILDTLLSDANRNYQLHLDTRKELEELVDELRNYRAYIDQKVFWVRSAPTLQLSHLKDCKAAFDWLFNRTVYYELQTQISHRFSRRPFQFVIGALVLLLLIVIRPRLRKVLRKCGKEASPISCDSTIPTLRASWITMLLAVTGPLAVWVISELLDGSRSEPVRAIAFGLNITGLWLFSFELLRQLWRPGGLADAHFGWPQEAAPPIRQFARELLVFGTPLIFFASAFQSHGDPSYLASLGRISIILLLLLMAACSFRVLRPNRASLIKWLFGAHAETVRKTLLLLAVTIPLILAYMSASGYQYAAHSLIVNFLFTCSLLIILGVVRAFLFRWVRITRRRLRKKQLIESRERTAETEESDTGDIEALAAQEADVDLVEMDRQTRRLISLAIYLVGLIGIWWIWVDVASAADPILGYTAYSIDVDKDVQESITIGRILIALLAICFAVAGWRNIPGLVDVFLLGRIQVESSIRYAVSTVLQYVIGIAGGCVALSALGFSWDRMQWLVAAMGVGLGFGLQEVVANFVCGIILLFERPIRVGDIVTLGDTTGVVIRIRSRATTVRNWDRQEVVIPNKELITGRITNWTLSDHMNRIVIKVGIAYGTDTDVALDLLHEILADNPNVLDDPRPLVTFENFGDSTLDFTVRAYLENQDNRLKTVHDLHTAIHKRFNEERIEIAFPQQDLHLRSVDESVTLLENNRQATWPDIQQNG